MAKAAKKLACGSYFWDGKEGIDQANAHEHAELLFWKT
jgi:hypothetical protein